MCDFFTFILQVLTYYAPYDILIAVSDKSMESLTFISKRKVAKVNFNIFLIMWQVVCEREPSYHKNNSLSKKQNYYKGGFSMKNLNKALAMVLVVALMISTVAFASSFSDVQDTETYSEAVNVGVALNLFKGYEDGTFKPEGDITRAEFAAIVVRMLGQEASATGAKTATSFQDVPADNWAAGYVNVATRMGIINGYGDGNFGPDDKVLYEQALKMIVVALGYAPTIGSAGYPVGYITKANELNITNGVNGTSGAAANRGTVAQIVFNAMDVALMTQSGYGTYIEYAINDGSTDEDYKTALTEYQNVVKLQVKVEDVTKIDGQIKVIPVNGTQVTKVNRSKFVDLFSLNASTIKSGTSGIENMIGQRVTAYIACDSTANVEDSVVLYANKDVSKVTELTVAASDVDGAVVGDNGRTNSVDFYYWANATDRQAEVVEIVGYDSILKTDKLPTVYWNGEKKDYANAQAIVDALYDNTPNYEKPLFYGTVTFSKLDNLSTGDYDTIFVTHYENVVVDTVNAVTGRVTTKNLNSSIIFDPDNTSYKSTLYDDKGTELKWTDLKEWDVVSCKKSKQGTSDKTITVGTLVNNTVTGKVDGAQDQDTPKVIFTIGGKEYKIDSRGMDYNEIAMGDTGTFYLDVLGRIAYYNLESGSGSSNYAYVVKGTVLNDIETKSQLKLYTAKGEMVTYNVAQTVKLDGVSMKSEDVYKDDADVFATAKTPVTGVSATRLIEENGTTYFKYSDSTVVPPVVDGAVTVSSTLVNRVKKVADTDFITFELNGNNEITSIDRAYVDSDTKLKTGSKINFAKFDDVATYITYDAVSESFSGASSRIYVTPNTVIMGVHVPTGAVGDTTVDEDKFDIFAVSAIGDEQKFEDVIIFNVNEKLEIGAILVKDQVSISSPTDGFAAVKSIGEGTNTAGDTVLNIGSWKNGVDTLLASVDKSSLDGSINETSDVAIGDIVMPQFNAQGAVKNYGKVAGVTDFADNFVTIVSGINVPDKTTYYYGEVKEIRSRAITFKTAANSLAIAVDTTVTPNVAGIPVYSDVTGAQGDDAAAFTDTISTTGDTNVYIWDERSSSNSNRVTVGDISEIGIKVATRNDYSDAANKIREGQTVYEATGSAIVKVYAVAREYDGKVVDVVLYVFK